MGQKKNWEMFIQCAKVKAAAHMLQARHWDMISNFMELSLIFLSSVTTILVLLKFSTLVSALVSGIATMMSAIVGYLKPKSKREEQLAASKDFKVLMMRMVRCESDKEYEQLWSEYNKAILNEPFLPKTDVKKLPVMNFATTMELTALIHRKDAILDEMDIKMDVMDQKEKERNEHEKEIDEKRKEEKEKRKQMEKEKLKAEMKKQWDEEKKKKEEKEKEKEAEKQKEKENESEKQKEKESGVEKAEEAEEAGEEDKPADEKTPLLE